MMAQFSRTWWGQRFIEALEQFTDPARLGRGRAFADQFDLEAAFFLCFAQRGNFRILIEFNMPAERQPLVQFAMMDQQNPAFMNDKNGDGEVDFFMDVSHRFRLWQALCRASNLDAGFRQKQSPF
jgi:hypothetical protein